MSKPFFDDTQVAFDMDNPIFGSEAHDLNEDTRLQIPHFFPSGDPVGVYTVMVPDIVGKAASLSPIMHRGLLSAQENARKSKNPT